MMQLFIDIMLYLSKTEIMSRTIPFWFVKLRSTCSEVKQFA